MKRSERPTASAWKFGALHHRRLGNTDLDSQVSPNLHVPELPQKKIELDATAARLVSFVEYAPLAMFSLSTDGTVVAWNRAAERMFGWSAQEVIGRFVPFVDNDRLVEAHELLQRTMAGQPVVDVEITRRRRDGRVITLSVSNAPLLDDNGKAVGIISIASDITERHRTQAALNASRARNDLLLSMSVDWYWEQDADLRFTGIEGSGPIATRLRHEQVIGKTRRELPIFGVSPEQWAKHDATLRAHQPFRGFTYAVRSPAGEERIFRISGDPIFDGEGHFRGYRGVGTDVTPLVRATQALQERERTFATLMGNLPGMVYRMLADKQNTIVFASEGCRLATGYAPDEIQQHPKAHLLSLIFQDDRERVLSARARELAARRSYVIEYRILDKNGARRWVWEHACGLYNDSDQLEAIEGFILDITERKNGEQALRLFRSLIDQLNDGIEIIDPATGCILDVNEKACADLGYTREELLSLTVPDIDPYVTIADRRARHERFRRSGPFVFESVHRRKDGSDFPVEVNLSIVQMDRDYVVTVVRDITARKSQEARIEYLAYHDAVTGLPNRTMLVDRLQLALANAQRGHRELALMFVDLDRFKTINDTLGHPVGDALLKQVAERLRHAVREGDTVARVGGDEFLILLPSLSQAADAMNVVDKALAVLNPVFVINGYELHISASAGVAIYPRDGMNAETLLKHADVAMYQAKDYGRNTYRFFSSVMNARAPARLLLENGLRRAIERDELELHYQPQVDARTERLTGVEALLRWRHPEGGLLLPNEFIPIAEDSGLILLVGEWVLERACRQARAWQDCGFQPFTMAVNVSPRQLRQHDLADRVARILAQSGLEPRCLELEITESSVMADQAVGVRTLRELRRLGVRVALDDFGTGYSSISHLKQLPLDRVKIDRSFLGADGDEVESLPLVELIIAMSHQLSLSVVAEGVETHGQLDLLRRWGCETIQGHLFCAALPANAIASTFTQSERGPGLAARLDL